TFDRPQSHHQAREIAGLGEDMIECGHARISADERERVRAVVAAVTTPVLAHARARREDIDAVLETGGQWVGLFASINAISL
ncbi:2-isopropylmalate synthase, partial [Pseudomonas aeruginosa]